MNPIVAFFWGSGLRKAIVSICGVVAAIAGAVVAIPPAWSTLGLPEVASKTFVNATLQPILDDNAKIHVTQATTAQAVNQLLLAQYQAQLYQAQKDKIAAPSPTVDQRIEELQQQIATIQAKINQGQ
ncbi:MAG TPA: hypothetical protein VK591_08615 [Xanthobacteraceae bacterium]|nr:hypothetical protein [Xanthobacteraceae bacterium]